MLTLYKLNSIFTWL